MEQLLEPTEQPAWAGYLPYGSEGYIAKNVARRESAALIVNHYVSDSGNVWAIGTINNHEPNNLLAEHDYDPGSVTLKEIKQHFETYLGQVPEEQQAIIVEGGFEKATFDSLENAITLGAEAGMMSYLGKQKKVDVLGGEPSDQDIYSAMEAEGVECTEITALQAVRLFGVLARRQQLHPADVALELYNIAVDTGVKGFTKVSEEEKKQLETNGQSSQKIIEMADSVAKLLLPPLNEVTKEILDGNDLYEFSDGRIKLAIVADPSDGEAVEQELLPLWHPDSSGRLSEVWQINGTLRDKFLFKTITQAVRNGKSPFVVYGGPHIVCLEPVLVRYFSPK